MAKYSQQGYPITFKCTVCGEEFYLDKMHYNEYTNERVCDGCFKAYRDKQLADKEKFRSKIK